MANNYSGFSEAVKIPEDKMSAVAEYLEKWEIKMEDPQYDYFGGITYSFPRRDQDGTLNLALWCDENYMDEELVDFVQGLLEAIDASDTDYVIISVAFWCDKPRTGEFGGGAYAIWKDAVYYVDPLTAVIDYVKFHDGRPG